MSQIKRIAQWLKALAAPSIPSAMTTTSALEFDPAWHGDHWQNLLSSPMDARRYVMEDWATPVNSDLVATEDEVPAPALG
jgi:hypothetical protein